MPFFGRHMSFFGCAVNQCVVDPCRARVRLRNFVRFVPVALAAITVGACNQYTVATNKSGLHSVSQQALPGENQEAVVVGTVRNVAVQRVKHTPFKRPVGTQFASLGVASFYSDEQQTANGETFNPQDLTAAHRSLPFGTRLRVTNLATGQSVTVRVNDRGPFIPGRVVDVSYSAAESLGIVDKGIAKVKLDVIR
jgi:peptidoglycan lytic transglycosylase